MIVPIVVAGAGKVGCTVAILLALSGRYKVVLIDSQLEHATHLIKSIQPSNLITQQLDINDHDTLIKLVKENNSQAIVSCLPYFCNPQIAQFSKDQKLVYFDLTEDCSTVEFIKQITQNSNAVFVPQCGLAPGFINIIANHLMKKFDHIEDVKLRCGALPAHSSNALQYSLNWSTDGLINEYGNPCQAVVDGEEQQLAPLENLEELQIDGATYEVFNTSGGIGSLVDSYLGKVKNLNYRTIRYPGHCEKMRFLMQGLKLNEDRQTLRMILEKAIPSSKDDVVIVYVSVTGEQKNNFVKENYVAKFYPKKIHGITFSAIQMTTASCACAVIDIIMHDLSNYNGRIKQEQFKLEEILNNYFGKYLKQAEK